MKVKERHVSIRKLIVKPGAKLRLKDFSTSYGSGNLDKKEAENILAESRKRLARIQDQLYAHNRYSVLIIFQAMDAAGKDGAVKHIMSGFNPLGVRVHSFKAPNQNELDHHYLWRHMQALPARGEIAIHNRSHYENVLVTRIHPEYILKENLPGIESVTQISARFWQKRYRQIRRFEKTLVENGTVVLKFFLHLSKVEQKKRFLDRIDDPSKNWKFSMADLQERGHWAEYQTAYEETMFETSTEDAPWYIIPADDKWYARMAIATVISEHFGKLKLTYPTVSAAQRKELQKAKAWLLSETRRRTTKQRK